ncbi:MAG: OmpH family outer membrane protein [Bacteroidales bacterium]|nr:OmpH family outer membrane protein [Bacteroidales bacterium]
MKRITTFLIIALITVAASQSAMAQTLKFAHINNDELIRSMPEFDTAMAQLEKIRLQYVSDIELLQVEFNNAYNRYVTESGKWSDMVKQTKEEELGAMQQKIQDFQAQAQQDMTDKQTTFFQPIIDKAAKAVKDVGRENGFIYVFDTSKGVVLFFDETKSTDITTLVKAKLAIK